MQNVYSADTRPRSLLIQEELVVSKEDGFRARIDRPTTALLILRFCCTKVLLRKESLTPRESVLFYNSVDYANRIARSSIHPDKLMLWLATIIAVRILLTFQESDLPRWASAQIRLTFKKWSLNPREFLGHQDQLVRKYFRTVNRRLKPTPPPKRFIGVGYGDQGAAKILHLDGNPSWQIIATNHRSTDSFWETGNDKSLTLEVSRHQLTLMGC